MTWEQEFMALQALLIFSGSAALHMRHPGDWYVGLPGVNKREKHVTSSGGGHSGKTPEDAVNKAFAWAIDPKFPLEINGPAGKRLVKWNGFMWADAEMPQ